MTLAGPEAAVPRGAPAGGSFFARVAREPNAIWMREMRQSARLGRTPWILFALTLTIALLMCSVGGIAAAEDSAPANIGSGLFQAFFSIAYFVVTLIGPALAANGIASEREGKTWEAVLLSGLTPTEIARGKFLAAYTTMAVYIVTLAPVGALSFLFGGITAVEVAIAFVILFVLAALAVAFGLAVSSLMTSLRPAIVVTLMLAVMVGPGLYSVFGLTCSFAVHQQWPEVPEAFPIWLPLAYERAPFGLLYAVLLVGLPLVLIGVPAWFLYEVTISNLSAESDDRSTGLKRWFTVATPLVAAACVVPSAIASSDDQRLVASIGGVTAFALYSAFASLLFAFEMPGPSRRVRVHWTRTGAGAVRRFFGPGLMKSQVLVALLGFVGMCAIAAVDAVLIEAFGASPKKETCLQQVFVYSAYASLFFLFVVGLATWLRARGSTPWVARFVTLAIIFAASAGPWVVAAIGGAFAHSFEKDWLLIGSPSPIFAFVMVSWLDRVDPGEVAIIGAGLGCAMAWGFVGFVLLAVAGRRCVQTVRAHQIALAEAEAALDAEDRSTEAAAPPGVTPPMPGAP